VADDPVEDPRLLQANERTLLSWLRTGVALITFGFVIAKTSVWAKREEPLGAYRGADLIGALFVLLGAVAEVVGLVRYLRIRPRVARSRAGARRGDGDRRDRGGRRPPRAPADRLRGDLAVAVI
jgi:uncharacterized membrane protein YidH (DUF202 family)